MNKDIKLALLNLKNNRLLRDDGEYDEFEIALNYLSDKGDYHIINELCMAFDDNIENDEVMFGIIHLLESFEGEEGLKRLAVAIPLMLESAKNWAKILHYRILNDAPSRQQYIDILKILDGETLEVILGILKEIKQEDPDEFSDYVNEILIRL
jgi:hypothetical protein